LDRTHIALGWSDVVTQILQGSVEPWTNGIQLAGDNIKNIAGLAVNVGNFIAGLDWLGVMQAAAAALGKMFGG
jgi:hypothetical protein